VNTALNILFMLLPAACGVVAVIRFRGSPAALLGGLGFGLQVLTDLTRQILSFAGAEWWRFDIAFTLGDLAGAVLILSMVLAASPSRGTSSVLHSPPR